MRMQIGHPRFVCVVVASVLVACADAGTSVTAPEPDFHRVNARVDCDADNAGITLPPGFCAVVVADLVDAGRPALARHLAVTPSGDVFVAINQTRTAIPTFGIIGLRDNDGDGRADQQSRFSPGLGGSGLAWGHSELVFRCERPRPSLPAAGRPSHARRRAGDRRVRPSQHGRSHQQDRRPARPPHTVRQHRVGVERLSGRESRRRSRPACSRVPSCLFAPAYGCSTPAGRIRRKRTGSATRPGSATWSRSR